jgi:hypothetical protein
VSALCRYAGLRSREEEVGVFNERFPECNRVPDITICRGGLHCKDIVLDVPVACPLPGAELTNAQGLTRKEAGVKGRAALARQNQKTGKYQVIAQENNLDFVPAIFESTGYMDDVLSAFVNKVVTHASELRCIPKDVLYKHWVV